MSQLLGNVIIWRTPLTDDESLSASLGIDAQGREEQERAHAAVVVVARYTVRGRAEVQMSSLQ